MKFSACEHLDYTTDYAAKKQVLASGHVFWLREASYEGAPTMVQFCSKRGRLNDPQACLAVHLKRCNLYKDHIHTVPDESIPEDE